MWGRGRKGMGSDRLGFTGASGDRMGFYGDGRKAERGGGGG